MYKISVILQFNYEPGSHNELQTELQMALVCNWELQNRSHPATPDIQLRDNLVLELALQF